MIKFLAFAILALFASFFATALGKFWRSQPKAPPAAAHRHLLKAVGVRHEEMAGQSFTIVLCCCECGDPRTLATHYLYGCWEVADLQPWHYETELSRLRQIAGLSDGQKDS